MSFWSNEQIRTGRWVASSYWLRFDLDFVILSFLFLKLFNLLFQCLILNEILFFFDLLWTLIFCDFYYFLVFYIFMEHLDLKLLRIFWVYLFISLELWAWRVASFGDLSLDLYLHVLGYIVDRKPEDLYWFSLIHFKFDFLYYLKLSNICVNCEVIFFAF